MQLWTNLKMMVSNFYLLHGTLFRNEYDTFNVLMMLVTIQVHYVSETKADYAGFLIERLCVCTYVFVC